MHSAACQPQRGQWLLDSGLKRLDLLFRAIAYQPAEPILIADNDRNYRDANCGAGKLFGLSRDRIIGRSLRSVLPAESAPDHDTSVAWPSRGIPALAEYFTRKDARKMSKQVKFIERSVILSRGPTLRAPLADLWADAVATAGGTLAEVEREYIIRVLRETGGALQPPASGRHARP
jgi:PAS domain S-box-containing protein